jgi:hypothetical protein
MIAPQMFYPPSSSRSTASRIDTARLRLRFQAFPGLAALFLSGIVDVASYLPL